MDEVGWYAAERTGDMEVPAASGGSDHVRPMTM